MCTPALDQPFPIDSHLYPNLSKVEDRRGWRQGENWGGGGEWSSHPAVRVGECGEQKINWCLPDLHLVWNVYLKKQGMGECSKLPFVPLSHDEKMLEPPLSPGGSQVVNNIQVPQTSED